MALAAAIAIAVVAPVAAQATDSGKVGRIAFGVIAADSNTDIYSVMPDGSGQQRLTTAKSFDACAAYSPNGRQIAFCSDRTGKYQVWLMQQDGSGQHQLTRSPYDALFPRYSPDGKRIAYEADDHGPPKVDIYVVGVRGGAPDGSPEHRATTSHRRSRPTERRSRSSRRARAHRRSGS